jgi:acetyl-CoA acetyltransferase
MGGQLTGAAIAGLGITERGKVYGRSSTSLAAEAVRLAAADAGLELRQLDGLLVSGGIKQDVGVSLASVLALGELRLLAQVNAFGATAGVMVAQAVQAIASGSAMAVACVFADTPLQPQRRAGSAWGAPRSGARTLRGLAGWSLSAYYMWGTRDPRRGDDGAAQQELGDSRAGRQGRGLADGADHPGELQGVP